MSQSIRKRFAFTLGANLFRSIISFTTGMLLARWLGPETYGNMAFLLGTFLGVRQLLDMGSSSAFLTFLSQQPRTKGFVRFFFVWLALQFLFTLCVIGLLFPDRWIETIWHGEQRNLVLLAFIAAFMQHSVWPIVQQAGESQRRTLRMQGIGIVVMTVHLLAVVLLWLLGILGLYAIFAAIALEYLLAAYVAHKGFLYISLDRTDIQQDAPTLIFRKYLGYCMPLIPYSVAGFAYEFVDRWLLHNYGGSVEQAYYAVGAQIAGIALIATASILRIFWKEVAEAHHQGNHARTRMLYKKVNRLLFMIGAMIAGFLIPWAEEVLHLLLGESYVSGATTLAIMFLYPVHQSMGQIGGTMLYATERTSLQLAIGIVFMIVSIAVTYLVLAPGDAPLPGLGLASEGLAIKMVVMQFIQVNIVAYIIAGIWKWSFDWVFQPLALLGCMGGGWVAHLVATSLVGNMLHPFITMGIGGLVYIFLTTAFVYVMPSIAGLNREELIRDGGMLWQNTKNCFKLAK